MTNQQLYRLFQMITSSDENTSILGSHILVNKYCKHEIDSKLFLCLFGSAYKDIEVNGVSYNYEYYIKLQKKLFGDHDTYMDYKNKVITQIKQNHDNKQTVG